MKTKIKSIASQKLKNLESQNKKPDPLDLPIKKFGKETPLFEFDVIETNRYGHKKNLIDVDTYTNESNYKYLKLWKLYQPNDVSGVQYEYSKQGITLPIKDAKKMIKHLYNIFYPPK